MPLDKKKIGCLALVLIVAALGIAVNLRPPSFSQDGKQALDDFIQRVQGPGFGYEIVSAQKGTGARLDNTTKLEAAFWGLARKPAGMCLPEAPQAKESWCVIVDRQVETSAEAKSTHFIVERQGQLWMVQQVPDSDAGLFQEFGCKW